MIMKISSYTTLKKTNKKLYIHRGNIKQNHRKIIVSKLCERVKNE